MWSQHRGSQGRILRFQRVAQASRTLGRLAQMCGDNGHAYCDNTMSCSALHEAWHDDYEAELAAAKYDIHTVSARFQYEMPDDSWPTAALLSMVSDLAQEPPWISPLHRLVRLTAALARLGERGLRADTVVRTCLGPQLLRRILLVAGSLWLHHSDSRDAVPQQLQSWFDLFDELQLPDPLLLTGSQTLRSRTLFHGRSGVSGVSRTSRGSG